MQAETVVRKVERPVLISKGRISKYGSKSRYDYGIKTQTNSSPIGSKKGLIQNH
jgi:hypothetical protein